MMARAMAASVISPQAASVPDEAARERVAGAGGVEHFFERHGGRREELPVARAGHQDAVLAALDDDRAGPHRPDGARGLDQVGLVRQFPRLGVVDDQHVDALEHLAKLVRRALDPEVHGVGRHQAGRGHLVQHLELQPGMDVAQEHERRRAVRLGDDRPELLEHVQLGVDGLPGVEIEPVLALPAERLAGHGLQTGQIDGAPAEDLGAPVGEVFARPPPRASPR